MVSSRPHFLSLNQTGDQHSGISCPVPGARQQKPTCRGRLRSPPWAATAGFAPAAVRCSSRRDTRKPQSPPHCFLSAERSREALIPPIPPPVPVGAVPHITSPLTVRPAVGQPRVPAAPARHPDAAVAGLPAGQWSGHGIAGISSWQDYLPWLWLSPRPCCPYSEVQLR